MPTARSARAGQGETMDHDAEDAKPGPRNPARRQLLKGIGSVGAAAAIPASALVPAAPAAAQVRRAGPPAREALESLTAAESDTLEAIVARLIPTDDNGP